jgi:hypothetical protein
MKTKYTSPTRLVRALHAQQLLTILNHVNRIRPRRAFREFGSGIWFGQSPEGDSNRACKDESLECGPTHIARPSQVRHARRGAAHGTPNRDASEEMASAKKDSTHLTPMAPTGPLQTFTQKAAIR